MKRPRSYRRAALCLRVGPFCDPVRPVDGGAVRTRLEEAIDLPAGIDPPGAQRETTRMRFRHPLCGQLADMQAELVDAASHEPVQKVAIIALREVSEWHGGVQRPCFEEGIPIERRHLHTINHTLL